jgi:hypothetical protein
VHSGGPADGHCNWHAHPNADSHSDARWAYRDADSHSDAHLNTAYRAYGNADSHSNCNADLDSTC